MVLGYDKFLEFTSSQRAAYRSSLKHLSTQRLRQSESENPIARISAGFTIGSGIAASSVTNVLGMACSGVGWRKGHVAHRKLEMIRVELLQRGEIPRKADESHLALAVISWAVGNMIGAGVVDGGIAHFGSGSSVIAAGAVAGGDIASSAAVHTAQHDSEALHGDVSVQDGFELGKQLVPAMRTELESIIKDPARPGLSYLVADASQHDLGNTIAGSFGSTAAFASAQVTGEVYSELLLKGYSHTFEADTGSDSTCARATSPRKIECNICSRAVVDGSFMRKSSPPIVS